MLTIRILCVDDHAIVRDGLKLIIDQQPDMHVVGSAATGEDAIALYAKLRPDVTLMDLELPDMSGLDALRAIRNVSLQAKIIVLTIHDRSEDVYRVLKAGAATYLLKETLTKDLIGAIRKVHEGDRPIPDEVAARLRERSQERTLTSREVEVLELIGKGSSNREIAAVLSISEQTVHGHAKSIFNKMNVRDRVAAVALAVRRGIIRFP